MLDFASTWERPGWTLRQWDEMKLAKVLFPLVNQDIYDRAEAIAPGSEGQLRSDVVRYELLYRYGGVYVDTDFECLRPIDELLEGVDCFAAWEMQSRWVNNAIIGCAKGDRFLKLLIDGLSANVLAHVGYRPNVLTGPQYLTKVRNRFPTEITVFPQTAFYPYGYNELDRHKESFPDAYAIHHWANNRRRRGVPLAT